jgi:hypothetical protein
VARVYHLIVDRKLHHSPNLSLCGLGLTSNRVCLHRQMGCDEPKSGPKHLNSCPTTN